MDAYLSRKEMKDLRSGLIYWCGQLLGKMREERYGEFDFDLLQFDDGYYYRVNFFHMSNGVLKEIVVNYQFGTETQRKERYHLDESK